MTKNDTQFDIEDRVASKLDPSYVGTVIEIDSSAPDRWIHVRWDCDTEHELETDTLISDIEAI